MKQEHHEYIPSNLIAGTSADIVTKTVAVTGTSLQVGTVLAKINDTDQYVKVDSTKDDGSEVAVAILAENIESEVGAEAAVVYLHGQFNKNKIIIDDETNYSTHEFNLRKVGIFLENTIRAWEE